MSEGDWLRPLAPAEAAGTAWVGRKARFELRPLSLGELLDRIFSLYKSRFWLFAAISMIAATVYTVFLGVSLVAAHKLASVVTPGSAPNMGTALGNLRSIGLTQVSAYGVMLIFFMVSAVTQAATSLALARVYLEERADAKDAVMQVLPRWYRWVGIALWQGFSAVWIPIVGLIPAGILAIFAVRTGATGLGVIAGIVVFLAVFGGVPAGIVLYLRNALAVPAAVTEGLTIRPAMRRSKELSLGTKGRTFVVLLIAGALLEVVAVLELPVRFLIMETPSQAHYVAMAASLLLTFVAHTVVAPVALIGLTLVYFDQRVRKEALDLQLLLDGTRPGGAQGLGKPEAATPLEGHGASV